MNYGLPYMGSKNKIAEWVVSHFPEKKHFYDLFAGGCAVTHCAMLKSKFETFTINDISKMMEFFTDVISGKYAAEKRWISRKDFVALKDNDEYVRICWSFGNNGKDYLYSKEIEPWKKALHYARVYGDFSFMEEFGIRTDGTRIDIKKNAAEYKEKYIRWYLKNVLKSPAEYERLRSNLEIKIKDNSEKLRAYLLEGLKKSGKTRAEVDRYLGTNGMERHYFGRSQWEFPTREVYIKLQSLCIFQKATMKFMVFNFYMKVWKVCKVWKVWKVCKVCKVCKVWKGWKGCKGCKVWKGCKVCKVCKNSGATTGMSRFSRIL
ncbi:MAG: DNA adenine methylase [Treponema sp.]|nr:MAG: DNA adenine methylase [Treponema sp.]